MLTWVEVNKQAIEHNLRQFKKLIGPKTLLMPVIKSNAYGHGLIEVAKICNQSKEVNRICVVSLDEATTLIKSGIRKQFVVLGFYELDKTQISLAIKHKVVFPVYRLDQINFINKIAKANKSRAIVHLKIDIGTTRIGILPKDALAFAKKIKQLKNLELEGIYGHFASSEDDKTFTNQQQTTFEQVVQELKANQIEIPIQHLACSAATTFYKQSHFNAVRLGLSLYGLYPSAPATKIVKLKPALSLNTKIVQVKNIPPNTKIGYGGTYSTKKNTRLAVLPVGYWDGLDRRMGNNAEVLVKGKRCPVRGRICMNLTMVDVSGVKNVKAGDTVTIIGQQGSQKISANDIATNIGTINYEVVDRINPLIKRIVK